MLIGPDDNDGLGPWYFSLNNRRLWVLKQCHKEGLLDNPRHGNRIPVRVRQPKSGAEAERYTVENCALEAKFMREGGGGGGGRSKKKGGKKKGDESAANEDGLRLEKAAESISIDDSIGIEGGGEEKLDSANAEDDSESVSDDDDIAHDNPFSALL